MSYDWGPYFIVPSDALKEYSGHVQLRERYDEDLLAKELRQLNMSGSLVKVTNPWYFRKKGEDTWIKIGESEAVADNFPVSWDTTHLENGDYEVLKTMGQPQAPMSSFFTQYMEEDYDVLELIYGGRLFVTPIIEVY